MKLNAHLLLMAIVAQRLSNISHRQQAFALRGMMLIQFVCLSQALDFAAIER